MFIKIFEKNPMYLGCSTPSQKFNRGGDGIFSVFIRIPPLTVFRKFPFVNLIGRGNSIVADGRAIQVHLYNTRMTKSLLSKLRFNLRVRRVSMDGLTRTVRPHRRLVRLYTARFLSHTRCSVRLCRCCPADDK